MCPDDSSAACRLKCVPYRQLQEDGGDSYDYEHAARATIRFQWDDHRRALSIGHRTGSFPGMVAKRRFHIVVVRPGHGMGDESTSSADRSVTYDGHDLKIDLGKKRKTDCSFAPGAKLMNS
jgi:alpha-D-xyloside xylohydrolase